MWTITGLWRRRIPSRRNPPLFISKSLERSSYTWFRQLCLDHAFPISSRSKSAAIFIPVPLKISGSQALIREASTKLQQSNSEAVNCPQKEMLIRSSRTILRQQCHWGNRAQWIVVKNISTSPVLPPETPSPPTPSQTLSTIEPLQGTLLPLQLLGSVNW